MGTFIYYGDSYEADGVEERKKSIFFGPLLKVGPVEAHYVRDIQGRSHGNNFKITFAPEFRPFSNWVISPRPSYQYWDRKFTTYYYGVNENEARNLDAQRSYHPNGSHNFSFALRNILADDRFRYVISAKAKFFDKEIHASPIMDEKVELRLVLGLLYHLF